MTTTEQYNKVLEFMKACSQDVNTSFVMPSYKVGNLRIKLIAEEIEEFMHLGVEQDNAVEILDALCDILYVVYGAAATFGVVLPEFEIKTPPSGDNILPMNESYDAYKDFLDSLDHFIRGSRSGDELAIHRSLTYIVSNALDFAYRSNMDIAGAFNEVHESNMSKFCDSYDQAYKHCLAKGTEATSLTISPLEADKARAYTDAVIEEVKLPSKSIFVIKRLVDGKGLKGNNFFEPCLVKFLL